MGTQMWAFAAQPHAHQKGVSTAEQQLSIDDAVQPRAEKVSVCMATWNGVRYLEAQLESILPQLHASDELVIVDDASGDGSPDIIRGYAARDPRVRVFVEKRNRGSVQTFGLAIERATGDVLMLADQDDVWLPGRIGILASALGNRAEVAASNLATLGGPDRIRGPYPWQSDWRLRAGDSTHNLRNLAAVLAGAAPYFGCAMAFRRECRSKILPFPPWLDESHDQWIALYGILNDTLVHVEERTIARRLHDANLSTPKPRGMREIAHSRWLLVKGIAELRRRLTQAT